MFLEHEGLSIQTDRLALTGLAGQLGASLPENPRVLILGPRQFIPSNPDIVILGPRVAQLPELRDENDIIINVPNSRPTTYGMTTALAGALLLRKAEEQKQTEFFAGLGVASLGVIGSCVGYAGMHNKIVEWLGYGIVVTGGILIAKSRGKAKVDLPNLDAITNHPITLVKRV